MKILHKPLDNIPYPELEGTSTKTKHSLCTQNMLFITLGHYLLPPPSSPTLKNVCTEKKSEEIATDSFLITAFRNINSVLKSVQQI